MKNAVRIPGVILLLLSVFLVDSCIEDKPTPPIITTTAVTTITQTTANSGGDVTNDGGETETSRGVCWNSSANPTIANSKTTNGSGTGSFTSIITGLSANSTYYLRAFATNSAGTEYGTEVIFKTALSTLTDVDANTYYTVGIGSQVWMRENLKTTKYRDGNLIANVTDNIAWSLLTTGAYCWYNNDATIYKNMYGALYNWYTVSIGKLCPTGWHVPSDAEWTTLTDYLTDNGYGYQRSGDDIAKSVAAPLGWNIDGNEGSPGNDQMNNNSSGFTAHPGGYRHIPSGTFGGVELTGLWGSSSELSTSAVWGWFMDFSQSVAGKGELKKQNGFSVRCLKD